jgi:hypothetical protein
MAPPRYLFDRWGTCFGHIDDRGRYFDRQGKQLGRVGADGAVVGCDGACQGRIDVQGQLWDEKGISLGYLGPKVPAARPSERSDHSQIRENGR